MSWHEKYDHFVPCALTLGGDFRLLFVFFLLQRIRKWDTKKEHKIKRKCPSANEFIYFHLAAIVPFGIRWLRWRWRWRRRRWLLPYAIRASKNKCNRKLEYLLSVERAQISCRLVIIKCCKTQWVSVIWNGDCSDRQYQMRNGARMHRERWTWNATKRRTATTTCAYMKYRFVADKNRSFGECDDECRHSKAQPLHTEWCRALIIYQIDDIEASANKSHTKNIINEFNRPTFPITFCVFASIIRISSGAHKPIDNFSKSFQWIGIHSLISTISQIGSSICVSLHFIHSACSNAALCVVYGGHRRWIN